MAVDKTLSGDQQGEVTSAMEPLTIAANGQAETMHDSIAPVSPSEQLPTAISPTEGKIPEKPKGIFTGPEKTPQSSVHDLQGLRPSLDLEPSYFRKNIRKAGHVGYKYGKFIGPGFMVSVAYIDPGNYATDASAGAEFRYKLLFMVMLSNFFAIFLQSLCIKLGSVTGLNLAEMCRKHCPRWLNYLLYFFAESAIIATDIAEVTGTAIALNLLFGLNVVAGCIISIVDVLIIMMFYNQDGSMRGVRIFEMGVSALVIGVFICFCYELSRLDLSPVRDVFDGFVPSRELITSGGLLQAAGILGATVMPHSLYLGSGITQSRLKAWDEKHNAVVVFPADAPSDDDASVDIKYRPSLSAIKSCMKYSIVELAVSLFTFALFINSAILIVAGAALYNNQIAISSDLFGIHTLLAQNLSKAAATVFALSLLISGVSAGIICTIAGQMVSEGALRWRMRPWMRRLLVRSISIVPSVIVAGAVGKEGLSAALQGTQVALSVILPFVSAPLIWFTCFTKYMSVPGDDGSPVSFRNSYFTAICGVILWLVIAVINGALIVLTILGKA